MQVHTGCVEPTIAGKHFGHTNCMLLNMVAPLEMALHDEMLRFFTRRGMAKDESGRLTRWGRRIARDSATRWVQRFLVARRAKTRSPIRAPSASAGSTVQCVGPARLRSGLGSAAT